MKKRSLALFLPILLYNTAPLQAAEASPAAAQLHLVIDEYWADLVETHPEFASSLGIDDPQGRLTDQSLAAQDRFVEKAKKWLTRIDQIDAQQLSDDDKTNLGILRWTLAGAIEESSFPQRVINFNSYSSWHQGFARLKDGVPFKKIGDYQTYVARLKKYKSVQDDNIAIANQAIAGGYTLPCDALGGFDKTISGLIIADPIKSSFYEPFTKPVPEGVDASQFAALAAEAAKTISTSLNPLLKEHLAWYQGKYLPNCAKQPGISAQPRGREYYDFLVRKMTTTNLTAEQIHQIGLGEVARILKEMDQVAADAGFASRAAYIQHLRTDPQYYAKTPEELMEKVARVNKFIDGKMPSIIGKLPRLPYGIKEIPAAAAENTTTAFYSPGSPDVGIAGFYFVNTSKLDQRPFWEIPALSAHEAVPGHHMQIALQSELDIPDFRRYDGSFNAFVEGWALYAERLGIEIGLYDTPAKNMGRLSYEMWRAARLVVDTGIHSKGWSKQQAIDFMTENSALSAANIEAEVKRYISWPGQALGYKIGELKIRELRSKATEQLSDKFDLLEFNDAVLGQGSVPLDVLEVQIDRWISAKKAS